MKSALLSMLHLVATAMLHLAVTAQLSPFQASQPLWTYGYAAPRAELAADPKLNLSVARAAVLARVVAADIDRDAPGYDDVVLATAYPHPDYPDSFLWQASEWSPLHAPWMLLNGLHWMQFEGRMQGRFKDGGRMEFIPWMREGFKDVDASMEFIQRTREGLKDVDASMEFIQRTREGFKDVDASMEFIQRTRDGARMHLAFHGWDKPRIPG
jgi:hypothetical protein